jgi:YD repeat-containing protein
VSATYPDVPRREHRHDSVGNRTSEIKGGVTTTATYDNANRLTAQGGTTFTHDNNGNRLSMSPGGRSTSYAYDPEDRLKTVSGASSASFTYDGDGYRVSKTVGRATTAYTWDRAGLGGLGTIIADGRGANLFGLAGLQERIASGAAQYVHGPGCTPGALAAWCTLTGA